MSASFPDLTANYKFKGGWGHMRLNGLVRQLVVDDAAIPADPGDPGNFVPPTDAQASS